MKRVTSLWLTQTDTTLIKRLKLTSPVMGKIKIMYHLADAIRAEHHHFCDIPAQDA